MATVTNFANAYQSVLTADMAATDLVASVQSTDRAPTSPCYLVIDPENTNREYILFDGSFTATTFSATTINNRYLSGSAASSGITHAAGAVVRFAPLAQHFNDLHARVTTHASDTSNPHTVTASQAGAEPAGAVANHEGATDPHPVYLTGPEGDARYPQLTLVDAKGDLLVGSAADTLARLAPGTDGQILKADSAATTGLTWGSVSAGTTHALARKTADESVASSTALQADDDLFFAVAANEVWVYRMILFVSGGDGSDISTHITVPSGAAGRWGGAGLVTSVTGAAGSVIRQATVYGGTLDYGIISTVSVIDLIGYVANGATAGNVQLMWAQKVSGTTATNVLSGSHLIAHKVA